MVTGINLAVAAALLVPATKFILSPLSRRSKEKWVDVLGEGELLEGETREVSYLIKVNDGYQEVDRKYTVYLYKSSDGIKCFDPGCRITYQKDKSRYFCPCHGGIFSEQGAVISGPPPTGLLEHGVKVKDGRILVSRQV